MADDYGTVGRLRSLSRFFQSGGQGRREVIGGPLRGELLGADQLAEKARSVARKQRFGEAPRRKEAPLLTRLTQTRRILNDSYERLTAGAARKVDVGPAGDWLLDNFHVVREQIREVTENLPRGYYHELPELVEGPLAGYPRVYELAITLISHTEARIDPPTLDGFVTAFQEPRPLTIGELWALPAMLRLALIESVRRMALRTVQRMDEIESADAWAARIAAASEPEEPEPLGVALDAFIGSPPLLTPTFVSRFVHQLRMIEGSYPPLAEIEQWIGDRSWSAEDATSRATHHLALTQVMMANSITSLRTVAHLDWATFVEKQSAMEGVLREDPAGFYSRMTFATRDRYRHVVERIARRTGQSEQAVARLAIDLADGTGETNGSGDADLRSHVGYYLVDEGLSRLEAGAGYQPRFGEVLHRWVLRHPDLVFGGGILVGTALALAGLLWLAGSQARTGWVAILVFGFLPAMHLAVGVVNQFITWWVPPRSLPRLDFRTKEGIPGDLRTAVVVPTLFGSVEEVREEFANLEVQFLANREANLHFAVLSDFTDAAGPSVDTDAEILEAAVEAVRALNERYAPSTGDAFYLLHRPRRWNESQGVWMGWERKRGKLNEFNQFIRGGAADAFSAVVGDVERLREVRFVITLDADTALPAGAAQDLVGTISHPLNRGVYNPQAGRVTRGYGIIQPRVDVLLTSAHLSRFASIHSGHPGVDPYTAAVSDVYQDLYGEGSFTGKGIYDVDLFEQATHGRFPENTLLSHDLVEGSYVRAGLATDITVYDEYPTRYLTHARRKHRWIRGDWQILDWLTPHVPGPDGTERNRLSLLSRWKIFDNLRRSTVEISQLLFLIAGWTLLPGFVLVWTALGIGAIAGPWLFPMAISVLRPPRDRSWRAYYAGVRRDAATGVKQAALAIAFLPHQAWISGDAIVRTLWRLFVTRKCLLEWQTASTAERKVSGDAAGTWREMLPVAGLTVAIGLAVVGWVWVAGTPAQSWGLAAVVTPLIAFWLISPGIAHALTAPPIPRQRPLTPADRDATARLALLHWRYFDRFVTERTHWLVPDNFQADPSPVVAMRTSPTNIGLQLLSIVSAADLGFITQPDMIRRLERAFDSLDGMARFRGHLFNWYDLNDLRVLEPAYVSTVDSGNLAGHLLALRQACLSMRDGPPGDPLIADALRSALRIARERLLIVPDLPHGQQDPADALGEIAERIEVAEEALGSDRVPSGEELEEVATILRSVRAALSAAPFPDRTRPASEWIEWSLARIAEHPAAESEGADERKERLEVLASRAQAYAAEMDFTFLFDEERELFSIGYQHTTHTLDRSHYDLFASESRLASFIAIAKGDVPAEHWFRLGRGLTRAAGETALISWSGGMFEYLMPALVMRSMPLTLLDQTYRGAVHRQIAYGAESGVPWGVSESAYNVRDRHQTYQYRAFGVPDLALKRGLGRDLVVAPYASALAMLVEPGKGLANLAAIEARGALGEYGFHDALDYTRPDPGERYSVVANYMAHHIGMALTALTNVLSGGIWQDRFHADPLVRSAELLLHERVPRNLVVARAQESLADEAIPPAEVEAPAPREFDRPDTPQPHVALLGGMPYTVMVSHSGGGYSRYEDLAVTRWRADGTTDATGQFCYIRDLGSGRTWSTAHQPMRAPADRYRAYLATDRATFHRRDGDIETRTDIAVVPEDAAEVRYVTVTNLGDTPRNIELTSYGEIVLGDADADRAHPAFSNLFVETEWHEWCTAITATRRPRSPAEPPLWCVHVVDTDPRRVGVVSCETDRARFLGRGRTPRNPVSLTTDGPLSGTTGAVLDPIFALRTQVRLMPGESSSVAFTTLVATSRERAFELAGRYHDPHAAQRALDLAWTSQQVELRELNLKPTDAATFQELAGHLIYPRLDLRPPRDKLLRAKGSQPLLWEHGISGDWPIVLASIDSEKGMATLRQLFRAHHYWRRRGVKVDVVVVTSQASSYLQELRDRIHEAMFASNDSEMDRPGGVYVRRRDQLSAETLLMIESTAHLRFRCEGRSLVDSLESGEMPEEVATREPRAAHSAPRGLESRAGKAATRHGGSRRSGGTPERADHFRRPAHVARSPSPRPERATALQFDNGLGGLDGGGAYEIRVQGDAVPPAPWSNVIANPQGGFVVSERGAGFTWADNSYFYRITPWHNDPVSDPPSEVLYLRDEETGDVWSATPAPAGHDSAFTVRHRPGATTFESERGGIAARLTLGMAPEGAAKLSVLEITNHDDVPRRISVTAYVEWTLGVRREQTRHHVRTSFDLATSTMTARNHFDAAFAEWVACCALSEPVTGHTGDRHEFLGRNGGVENPAGLRRRDLSGRVGAGLDPCAALQCVLELAPGESREVVFVLGAAVGEAEAAHLAARYRAPGAAASAIAASEAAWDDRLSTVTVHTPEPSFDAMMNRWALYQALSCRVWGRSAVYQSGGAYGFRDQLQDVMALLYAEPALAREHILRAAARQFVEGDVQHWWHPHSGQGVRTRFSDDLAWLPYAVDRYVVVTGDTSVLDESVPFICMSELAEDEHEVYAQPQVSDTHASVYEHCLRALRRASTSGPHGLPLIGGGDWNDGMNRVGVEGRGESVWLAWFLAATLRGFSAHAHARGDSDVVTELRTLADDYVIAVEANAWDGEWYRRAYFDDGTPLGSSESAECRIDSLAQSWSVISGAGSESRQVRAMRALEQHLVRPDDGLIVLLTPPFDQAPNDPGYIKGYLPGVRENGAQYTHAAFWAVLATALRGDGDRAFEWFQMLNPLTHTRTPEEVDTYKVEPYVVAADVYTAPGQVGRGGWTWYTGAASWMYRTGLEGILGFSRQGDSLRVEPCVPTSWESFSIDYRFGSALYAISVHDPAGLRGQGSRVTIDGKLSFGGAIPLVDDGQRHEVRIEPMT